MAGYFTLGACTGPVGTCGQAGVYGTSASGYGKYTWRSHTRIWLGR